MAQLVFRYSTMNAGKSLEILKIAHNYEEQSKTVLLFTPKIDNRYGEGKITSRMGVSKDAIVVDKNTRFMKHILSCESDVYCILVDEGQFLTEEHVMQLATIVDTLEIPVIIYGLKNTFQNKLFEGSEALLCFADKIEEIKTVCWYCNRKATMNLRVDGDGNAVVEGETIHIGGNESYLPVCRKCYNKNTNIKGRI